MAEFTAIPRAPSRTTRYAADTRRPFSRAPLRKRLQVSPQTSAGLRALQPRPWLRDLLPLETALRPRSHAPSLRCNSLARLLSHPSWLSSYFRHFSFSSNTAGTRGKRTPAPSRTPFEKDAGGEESSAVGASRDETKLLDGCQVEGLTLL